MNIDPTVYAPPRLSPEAIALIKHFEGCFLEAYRDPVGIWTIGYGHTSHVRRGKSLTPQEAENLLMEDLDVAQVDVRHNVKVPLNENEFGALVSLAFNIGGSAFAHSTLLRKLNAGDRRGAAKEFERFVNGHVGGRKVTLRGLQLRRRAEREMFEAPIGQLVRDGRMVLAGRTIPVEHPSYDVTHVGPPQAPPHHYFPPYPVYPAQLAQYVPPDAEPQASRAPAGDAGDEPAAKKRVRRATLISVGAGAAAGAIPATDTPAAQSLMHAVSDVWKQAGGPDVFPSATAWTRWVEAIGPALSEVYHKGSLTPLLSYAAAFIHSNEGLIVAMGTVGLLLLRSGVIRLFAGHSREA